MKSLFVITLDDIIGIGFVILVAVGLGGYLLYAVIYDWFHRAKKK